MPRREWLQMPAATMVTVCLLVFSGLASAQRDSGNALERVKDVQERRTAKLMAREGAVGTAVGSHDQGRNAVLVLLEPLSPIRSEASSSRPA